jgi:hypothetical protein
MRQRLRDVLADVDDATWNAGEKDDLLFMAVRRLSKRLPRPIVPNETAQDIAMVSGTYSYDIPTSITTVIKVLRLDADDTPVGYLTTGWEVLGDIEAGQGILHVDPRIAAQEGTLRLQGYNRYTLNTLAQELALAGAASTTILDDHVPLVLAWAQEGAWRRLLSDRARFRQWQNANQTQNVSINELVQMIGDASRQADEEWALLRRPQMPVIGRI